MVYTLGKVDESFFRESRLLKMHEGLRFLGFGRWDTTDVKCHPVLFARGAIGSELIFLAGFQSLPRDEVRTWSASILLYFVVQWVRAQNCADWWTKPERKSTDGKCHPQKHKCKL